ncbi:MAG: MFS transporter [Hyphomonadaceae bacterium]
MPANSGEGAQASGWRAWHAVVLLTLLYCVSFLDRFILALLAGPISAEMDISDTHLGLLIGTGFALFYAVMGIPLAHMLDRGRRILIVMIGVIVWSLCTIGAAFANTFTELLILRAGVAIGEATLSPAAISLIADMFPRERRTLPTSVYTSVSTYMGAGAFLLGGIAYAAATALADGGAALAPWRITLILVGLPGLILGPLLFFTVPEPRRSNDEKSDYATARAALAYLGAHRWLYAPIYVALGLYCFLAFGSVTWTPTFLSRAFGASPAEAGVAFGAAGLLPGVAGVAAWSALVKLWTKAGRNDAPILLFAIGLTITMLGGLTIGLAQSQEMALIGVAAMAIGGAASALFPPLVIQAAAAPQMRARLFAGALFANALFGFGLGPPAVAWFAETLFEGPHALGHALALSAATFGSLAIVSVLFARRAYLSALGQVQNASMRVSGDLKGAAL